MLTVLGSSGVHTEAITALNGGGLVFSDGFLVLSPRPPPAVV